MSTSLSPPSSPGPAQIATPQATTAAILGASSNGWSPLKLSKKTVGTPDAEAFHAASPSDAEHPSSQSPKKATQNFASLRGHGLVSNSIFKQGGSQPTSAGNSPIASPSKRGMAASASSSTRSIGLGIGVGGTPSKIPVSTRSPTKASSPEDADVFGTLPSESSLPKATPRKSRGFETLQKASYVSNSPFRQSTSASTDKLPESPLRPPQNAWAMSAAVKAQSSPRREGSDAGSSDGTVRSQSRHSPASSSLDSPSGKGLLVSNRLHGPRTMSVSPEKPQATFQRRPDAGYTSPQAALRRERRKTVTFDEILDVQEFDKESSFDIESMRSDASYDDNLDAEGEGMWVQGEDDDNDEMQLAELEDALRNQGGRDQNLKVVNGSPAAYSPELTEPELSSDSRDTSSVEESSSPLLAPLSTPNRYNQSLDISFDKTFATAASGDESIDRESSFSRLCAADRVDSMVDELLKEDILSSPTLLAHQGKTSFFDDEAKPESSPARAPISPPKRRGMNQAQNASQFLQQNVLNITPARSMQAAIHTVGATESPSSRPLPSRPEETKSQPSKLQVEGLPQLPDWSPITFQDSVMPESVEAAPAAEPARRQGSVRGRPHISRDAILQRVAKERANQAQSNTTDSTSKPESSTAAHPPARAPRGSEPWASPKKEQDDVFASSKDRESKPVGLHSRPSAPVRAASETDAVAVQTRPLPPPSPVKEMGNFESPLETITAGLAADDKPPAVLPKNNDLLRPPSAMDDDDESDRSGPSSGRLSPSTLGTPPPPITPAQQAEQIIMRRRSKNGGKGRRKRSMSTGDALPFFSAARDNSLDEIPPSVGEEAVCTSDDSEEVELPTRQSISADLAKSKAMLDVSLQRAMDSGFSTNLEREISRIAKQGEMKYTVNDRGAFKGVDDKISHTATAGDVDTGKAWRKLRRPSDMNEYAKEMREFRENENPKRASGKVFVMVDSFIPANLPVPSRPTFFHCLLDNGLHMVKTATVPLRSGPNAISKINQEFELIQHKNLEFSLTLVVQRDAHLREPERPSSPTRKEPSSPTLKAISRFFTSPRKQAAKKEQQERAEAAEMAAQASRAEPMMAYINRDGAFGRAGVVFEKVASQCHARCMVLELPVYGVNNPANTMTGPSSIANRSVTSAFAADFNRNLGKVRGTLRLKLFYLPPLPNMARTKMPENIGECIRGMQSAEWHSAAPWMEGTLTQLGGDCTSWRRRPVKAQGQFLVCYNEVTKKPTVKIDLSKAVCVEDNDDPVTNGRSKTPTAMDGRSSRMTMQSVSMDEDPDANYHVERSFRITFADGERISFFADTDEEKAKWMKVLHDITEKAVPPNPLWAQVALETLRSAPAGAQAQPVRAAQPRKPSQQMRKAPPPVEEESESTPQKSRLPVPVPEARQQSLGRRNPLAERVTQQRPVSEILPPPLPHKAPTHARGISHDPSGNVAFDRLRRAAANNRSQ